MIVSHCHVATKGFGLEVKTNPAMGTLPELRRIMRSLDIERAVVLAPFDAQQGTEPNQWLVQQLESYPEMTGFANIDPTSEEAADQVRECAQRGLVGLKLHPEVTRVALDDPSIESYWQSAEDLGLPIAIHTGVHGWHLRKYMPILLDDVAQCHPSLPLIIEHMGGVAMFDQALAVLHNNENCYVGLTQMLGRYPPYALLPDHRKLLLDTVGPDRIIYGLDYPHNENNLEALCDDIAWIRSWGLSAEDEAKILGANMERLLDAGAERRG